MGLAPQGCSAGDAASICSVCFRLRVRHQPSSLAGIVVIVNIQAWNKAKSVIGYLSYLVVVISLFDLLILNKLLGFGYPHHYEEETFQRYPAPYVEFIGKPDVGEHNEFGFRGPSFVESEPNDLKIAFFGGSTGYNGSPPIAGVIEKRLNALLGESVFVANYSVVSSNHRQHLHGIIEFLPDFRPDLVIFYGGYNDTVQGASYDPRPGYPYSFFYRSETGPFIKLLLQNSAIIGEIDKRTGILSGIRKLRNDHLPFSDDWNKRTADKYFETLMLANNVAGTIESERFGKTRFLAFYQPYQVPEHFMSTHNEIKERIGRTKYGFDVSSEYDALGRAVYRDSVHVDQRAKDVMGATIAGIVAEEIQLDRVINYRE